MKATVEVDDKGMLQISGLKREVRLGIAGKSPAIMESALNPMQVTALLAQAVSATLAASLVGSVKKEGDGDGKTESDYDKDGDRGAGGILSGETAG